MDRRPPGECRGARGVVPDGVSAVAPRARCRATAFVANAYSGTVSTIDVKIRAKDPTDYWNDAPYPELVKTIPHVAFEVDDLPTALRNHHVIIEPNSPSLGVTVAFIEVNGAPVELVHIDRAARPDL
jgi:hypothetical protein